ncbi:MAG: hypothetical protein RR817_08420 [Niameybacter sp.]
MKYVVSAPNHQIICFDHHGQVLEYCDEQEAKDLDAYCKDQDYNYDTLTPVDVGHLYTLIGAENGTCHIYQTDQVIKYMKENAVDTSIIEEVRELFNSRELNDEQNCPGYLSDVLAEMPPMTASQLLDKPYE